MMNFTIDPLIEKIDITMQKQLETGGHYEDIVG